VPDLYPKVELVRNEDDPTKFRVHLKNRGGGIGRVVVRVNGKEVTADARGEKIAPDAKVGQLDVDLAGDPRVQAGKPNVVTVHVYNKEGYLASRDLRLNFVAPGEEQEEQPKLWAVVCGVGDYRGEAIDLRYAGKDAVDFAKALELAAGRLLGKENVNVTVLSTELEEDGQRPTRANLQAALERLKDSKPADLVVLYMAGHGVSSDGEEGEFFYLTADAESAELTDPAIRDRVTLSSSALTEHLRMVPAKKQVLILDTCASGRLIQKLTEKRNVPGSQIRALERVKDRTGMYVLAGCAADAVSFEASQFAQGLLTHSLLLGMRGGALREEEFVDVQQLFGFAADRVPQLALSVGGIQRPVVAAPRGGGSFDIGQVTCEDKPKIPLQSPRPLLLRCNLQDDFDFVDVLGLAKRVDRRLAGAASRSRAAKIVFVDARELPDAYRLAGRYSIDGDNVQVTAVIAKGRERVARFEVNGKKSELDALAEMIVANVEKVLQDKAAPTP